MNHVVNVNSSKLCPHFKTGVFLFGCFNLALAIFFAHSAWNQWHEAGRANPSFWGILAPALFLFGIAQINLIGPVREYRRRASYTLFSLPYRLEPLDGGTRLIWPMLSLSFAACAPFVPLFMLSVTADGKLADFRLIWIGFALTSAAIGGITLYLAVQKLYQWLNGSQTTVETAVLTVKPKETLSLYVRHQSGRIPTKALKVKIACRETRTRRQPTAGNKGCFAKETTTSTLYEIDILPYVELRKEESIWQKRLSVVIPDTEKLSTELSANPACVWSVDVILVLCNAPDIAESFVFTVDDPELRKRWEREYEVEDMIEEEKGQGN